MTSKDKRRLPGMIQAWSSLTDLHCRRSMDQEKDERSFGNVPEFLLGDPYSLHNPTYTLMGSTHQIDIHDEDTSDM
ncbi:hypothetical protein BTUL_0147g00240 [Botrytis tulipae]|uniref:Uncharacterized protein n=1 Tax=Botrytis tulipae TaxID=87230 RepID=A0A4Z1EEV6_9HELO|nr:hypothetical protein BTUL_0147g00240 [Botrytis tulipae]